MDIPKKLDWTPPPFEGAGNVSGRGFAARADAAIKEAATRETRRFMAVITATWRQ
jgi:hypothetical protein